LLFAIYTGLRRLRGSIPAGKGSTPDNLASISIVIAARNEEARIIPCLKSLEKIEYPLDKYEVIFIDDSSSDRTAEIVGQFCQKHINWQLITIEKKCEQLHGKKNALLQGITRSKGYIIFTTDADCMVPPNWLKGMINYFHAGVSMVMGYSPLEQGKGLLYRLLQFDNLFSAIAAAAPTKLGYPFTSVGRNLAYRKDAYHNAGGFLALKNFRSGDDIHLTTRFRYLDTGRIDYCADPSTFVKTQLPSSLNEILHQQIRKNSKTFQLTISSIIFSLLIAVYYILLIVIPLFFPVWLKIWFYLFIVKFLLEYINLVKAALIFKQKSILCYIPLMQLLYPVNITIFSLLGILQFYHWKK
jgi:cellulose synthase/poly-beta-1,6-N-acetylglucosamine synthase-like glycosyltransferase